MNEGLGYTHLNDTKEVAALQEVTSKAFHMQPPDWDRYFNRIGRENFRIVRLRDRVIGGLAVYPIGQYFGGCPIPMAGIAAVAISPDQRGHGAAAFLMKSVLEELHDEGVPLSTLFASTQALYRKVGYEQAGNRIQYEMPLIYPQSGYPKDGHPKSGQGKLPISPVDPLQHSSFHDVAKARAELFNGNLDRNDTMWERIVIKKDKTIFAYLIGEESKPEGYIIFYQEKAPSSMGYDLHIQDMAVLTPAAGHTLWNFLMTHGPVGRNVYWDGPAVDPLLCITAEQDFRVRKAMRWLSRIVHLNQALTLRGYPDGVEGELHLIITDDLLPANSGRFILTVGDGKGDVREGGRGDLRTDIQGMVPLFTSMLTPYQLQAMGFIQAGVEVLALASKLFSGPEPWMPEMF